MTRRGRRPLPLKGITKPTLNDSNKLLLIVRAKVDTFISKNPLFFSMPYTFQDTLYNLINSGHLSPVLSFVFKNINGGTNITRTEMVHVSSSLYVLPTVRALRPTRLYAVPQTAGQFSDMKPQMFYLIYFENLQNFTRRSMKVNEIRSKQKL